MLMVIITFENCVRVASEFVGDQKVGLTHQNFGWGGGRFFKLIENVLTLHHLHVCLLNVH